VAGNSSYRVDVYRTTQISCKSREILTLKNGRYNNVGLLQAVVLNVADVSVEVGKSRAQISIGDWLYHLKILCGISQALHEIKLY
jgi:hypothetical protein